jgi:hypothetical protein
LYAYTEVWDEFGTKIVKVKWRKTQAYDITSKYIHVMLSWELYT